MTDLALKIDGQDFAFPVEGQFQWGPPETLFDRDRDLLLDTPLGESGFGVFKVLDENATSAFHEGTKQILMKILNRVGVDSPEFTLARYHDFVSDDQHQATIRATRELRFSDFHLDANHIADYLSRELGLELHPVVEALGRDHVQLRVNRPRSLDINPPHRDAYLSYWRNVLNLWMPICGCDEHSSLPVMEGSHLISEDNIFRTAAGGATINGANYRVPAISQTRPALEMTRPNPGDGELIAFTPFLIHGAAINSNTNTTRMALEFRLQIKNQVYSNDLNAFEQKLLEL